MTEAQKQLLIVLVILTTSPDYYAGKGMTAEQIHDHILGEIQKVKGGKWKWDQTFDGLTYIKTAVNTGGGDAKAKLQGTNAYYYAQKDFAATATALGWSGGGDHPRVSDLVQALNLQ